MFTHTPYATQVFLPSSLKYSDIETMANTVCRRRNTGDTSTNDGYFGSAEGFAPVGRGWGQDQTREILKNLKPEQEGME